MNQIVTASAMRQKEQKVIQGMGICNSVLMERAAYAVCSRIENRIKKKKKSKNNKEDKRTLIVCGSGNNGADGMAIARILLEHGFTVSVCLVFGDHRRSELNKLQLNILEQLMCQRGKLEILRDCSCLTNTKNPAMEYDSIIDAVFGIGLRSEITDEYVSVLNWMNQQSGYKIAVDICSGIHTDTGEMLGIAFKADETITFGAYKVGHYLNMGRQYSGKIYLDSCAMTYKKDDDWKKQEYFCIDKDDAGRLLKRDPQGNKASFGKLGIVAGSETIAGAAMLCAKAAFQSGGGYIRLLTHEKHRVLFMQSLPELVFMAYGENRIKELSDFASVVVVGPGIGMNAEARNLLSSLLRYNIEENKRHIYIFDADALNLIADQRNDALYQLFKQAAQMNEVIITPHILEFSRLSGISVADIKKDRCKEAKKYASANHVTVVLKDAQTVIASKEGVICINTTGNDGMAVAGSGDALCGLIAGLAGQKIEPYLAACLGVYLHGLAGDKAAMSIGRHGMRPTDLIDQLPKVIKKLEKRQCDETL